MRSCAKASSRFGPIVPCVPAAASVWHEPHAAFPALPFTNSSLPWSTSPPFEIPPVPQAAPISRRLAASRAGRSARGKRLTRTDGRARTRASLTRRRRADLRRPAELPLDELDLLLRLGNEVVGGESLDEVPVRG